MKRIKDGNKALIVSRRLLTFTGVEQEVPKYNLILTEKKSLTN